MSRKGGIMRKKVFLLTSMLIFALMLAGCSLNSMQEPPEISIHIGDKEIEYVSAKNKWNGNIYDREDTFITILKEQNEIPVFENGSVAEIIFTNNPPDEFIVMDMLINEDGNQIYTDKEIKNIPFESNDGKYSFGIDYHFASALSSFYEPEKTDIRGFRMIASWGEDECEYAFVIKTYTKNIGEQIESESSENLLLNGVSLTNDIIRSVYRGEENYTYEVLLFSLAVNDDDNNLYKGYFPFDEDKGFIFPLDKSNEVLSQVFGEREHRSLEDVFDYDEESDVYYKNLDFGWNTGYRAENVTADISDDKSKLYTKFELINQWYDVEGDPVPTAIAECEITYSINKNNDKIYLQFENIEVVSKLVD
jgi:hypothetical protein